MHEGDAARGVGEDEEGVGGLEKFVYENWFSGF